MVNQFSYISNAHPSFVENMYNDYKKSPQTIDPSWANFFKGFEYASGENGTANGYTNGTVAVNGIAGVGVGIIPEKEIAVMMLIDAYRHRGHLLSDTNPLKKRKNRHPHLDLAEFGLENDLDNSFYAGKTIGLPDGKLKDIVDKLNKIYCAHIGFEYSNIEKQEERLWLRERIENMPLTPGFGFAIEKKKRILEKLNEATGLEEFLGKKFVGKKRFSLEGGETTIPALDSIINSGSAAGVQEVIIGMAHRGRLNVLTNILGKTYESVFNEFEENVPTISYGSGDVKYHLGYSSQVPTPDGKTVYLKLLPNPSHLEAVDAVMLGFARAKADLLYNGDYNRILPIMIHGDAAVAGQGIVYEVLQMSGLQGYLTGGTVHFVINNQIGFTTDFEDARTSNYCSSVANTIQSPTFHVNGDDPEAVVFVSELAVAYRQKFSADVFVDMVCYRKHGHNESDNAEFTQPQMWQLIKNHKNPREIYTEQLINRSEVTRDLAEKLMQEYNDFLQARLNDVKQNVLPYKYQEPEIAWRNLKRGGELADADFHTSPETGISRPELQKILDQLMRVPDGFNPLKDILRYLQGKQKLLTENKIDWGYGELLAYASLLLNNKAVRLSGEDVKRGTFSHRHVCWYDGDTNKEYNRLSDFGFQISDKTNPTSNAQRPTSNFHVYNSLLSEYAVLGFEFGYAMTSPNGLIIWEAQFGDFSNGAQTIIDQFFAAGESKWQRQNGLVLLLPHGYEGQGPEHSSARIERFLQLCAENNMVVANVSTPANFFHLMRRHMLRPFRKPLVIMSPKSLLRHPECLSDISEFETGKSFLEIIDDLQITDIKAVKKVVFCSGKLYYDILEAQKKQEIKTTAVLRIEQLYPFPEAQAQEFLKKYDTQRVFWAQEEPQNMGAWSHIQTFHSDLGLKYIGRKPAASPATGYAKIHAKEQADIVAEVLSV